MKYILVFLVVVITLWIGMIQCQSLEEDDQLIEERGKTDKDEILMKLNKKLKKMGFGSRALQKNLKKIDSMAKDLAALGKKIGGIMKDTEENTKSIKDNEKSINDNEKSTKNNEKSIKDNADEIKKLEMDVTKLNETCNPTPTPKRKYLMFGGFDHDDVVTDGVYLIEVDIDNNISVSCNHSTLPKKLKESHAYEFQGTLLVCSSFTNDGTTLDKKNLNCFKWNETDWETFPTPPLDNTAGISNFIQSVKIPDVGIWFTSAKPPNSQGTPGNNSYLLKEDGTWEQKVWDNRARAKGCMIQYNDTHIAAIGGTPKECSDKIDTYNFVTEEFQENVATLLFNRTHHLCALIPEGKDGNPTVVILGDDGRDKYDNGTIKTSWAMEMTLWDTVTNEMTLIPHPPGIDNNHEDGGVHDDMRFFRPTMATWDDNTILLAASELKHGLENPPDREHLEHQFLYNFENGWINIGDIEPPPPESEAQYGIYMLDNMELTAYDSLIQCPP